MNRNVTVSVIYTICLLYIVFVYSLYQYAIHYFLLDNYELTGNGDNGVWWANRKAFIIDLMFCDVDPARIQVNKNTRFI